MDPFKMEVLQLNLDKMFNEERCFDICDFRKLGDMLGVNVRASPDYEALSALHCVHYSKMSSQMIQELQLKVVSALRGETSINPQMMARAIMAEIKSDEVPIEDVFLDDSNALPAPKKVANLLPWKK